MKVVVLGTAAGGGFPQWNCACIRCRAGRTGLSSIPPRTQDCVAVSGNGRDWWLLNASPDIRAQLVRAKALAPGPGRRDTPLRGVLLTDAELDHTVGLLTLREAAGLTVHAPAAVLHALQQDFDMHGVLGRYGNWHWRVAHPDREFELAGPLKVRPIAIGTKRPKYVITAAADGSTANGPWVVAYRIEDPETGGVLVYAPCLAGWPSGFDEVLSGADCLLLDGTFSSADELNGATGHGRGQSAMGHLPIFGQDGSLAALRRHPRLRRIYTHLNNTNPILDSRSPQHAELRAAGVEVVPDNTDLHL